MTKVKNIKWHKGPPPHVGWWLASVNCLDHIWRWWDGVAWSHSLEDSETNIYSVKFWAERHALSKTQDLIYWSDYYPKKARVPRIDPRKGGKE